MSETPLVRFRLYPEARRGLYVAVNVWETAAAMRRYARRTGDQKSARRNCHGYCACYRIVRFRARGPQRTLPVCAEVNLYAGRLTMEVVTHELFHATVQWGRRIGFDFSRLDSHDSINEDEERLTYAHSTMCKAFMIRACDAGLYG